MEELNSRKAYSADVAIRIEAMGSIAVSIANRWIIGWPARVAAMLKAGTYLCWLETQMDQEKDVLANEPNLRHLSRNEVMQMYEIGESPPC